MRRIFSHLLLLCLFIGTFHSTGYGLKVEVLDGVGFRDDRFNWSIAGPDREPKKMSELTWKDLRSVSLSALVRATLDNQIYFRGTVNYAKILSGKNRDSDYICDGRKSIEFSRSYSDAKGGELADLSGGLGYRFACCDQRLTLAPLIGYSCHVQRLRQRHGVQVISLFDKDFHGHFPGLNSSYLAKWKGIWIGADVNYQINQALSFFVAGEYHWADYRGEGHWNLREDIVKNFIQKASGRGVLLSVGVKYAFMEKYSLGLQGRYQHWQTGHGVDHFYSTDGHEKFLFNGAQWQSFALEATLGCCF